MVDGSADCALASPANVKVPACTLFHSEGTICSFQARLALAAKFHADVLDRSA